MKKFVFSAIVIIAISLSSGSIFNAVKSAEQQPVGYSAVQLQIAEQQPVGYSVVTQV